MCRLLVPLLAVCVAIITFALGAVSAVHCPIVQRYAGGGVGVATTCECGCGAACPCPCGCGKAGKCLRPCP